MLENGELKTTVHSQATSEDLETRQRLLDVAIKLFAEQGFSRVTVRDICQEAGANVAAVNYYFRDKLGLYTEVVNLAAEFMHRSKMAALRAGEGQPAEERLRRYIRVFLHGILDPQEESWMEKLIGREMVEPTPALDLIIEKGIKPSSARLMGIVAELLGCTPDDWRVTQCALSVQGQCVFYSAAKVVTARMSPGFNYTPEIIDALARHIAEFSLAGIRAIAQAPASTKN